MAEGRGHRLAPASCPDTAPGAQGSRGSGGGWDFATGPAFYLNASQSPLGTPLPQFLQRLRGGAKFAWRLLDGETALNDRRGISGHSMGGHGALVCALTQSGSATALVSDSPIKPPDSVRWGREGLQCYIGPIATSWSALAKCVRADRLSGPAAACRLLNRPGTRRSFSWKQSGCRRRIFWKRRSSGATH